MHFASIVYGWRISNKDYYKYIKTNNDTAYDTNFINCYLGESKNREYILGQVFKSARPHNFNTLYIEDMVEFAENAFKYEEIKSYMIQKGFGYLCNTSPQFYLVNL